MLEVRINDDSQEAFEKGMKTFKKICQKDGFLQELKDRKFYKKPSIKRREKKIAAIKLSKKNKEK